MLDLGFEMVFYFSLVSFLVYCDLLMNINEFNFFINGFLLFLDEGIGVDF